MALLTSVPDRTHLLLPTDYKPRDPLWPGKVLTECWSLSSSQEFQGELPTQSQAIKDLVIKEAILFHDRERRPEWEKFV